MANFYTAGELGNGGGGGGGGGSTIAIVNETPVGLINGSNTTYTLSQAPSSASAIINFAINGEEIHPNDYTLLSTTITMNTALPASLSGKQFTIVYATAASTAVVLASNATVTSASSPVTVAGSTFFYRANAVSGAITLVLPAVATSNNLTFVVKKIDSSANVVTVDGNASELIDGQLTKQLTTQYASVQVFCNGTSWDII